MARAHRLHVRRAESGPQFVRLGTWQFVVMVAGVALVLTAAGLAVYPSAHRRYLQDVCIKKFETEFGFRTGLVEWQAPGKAPELVWGVVAVTPNGAFVGPECETVTSRWLLTIELQSCTPHLNRSGPARRHRLR